METYKYNYLHSLIISNLGPVPWLALIQFLFFWGFIPLDLTVMATYSGDKFSQEKRYNGQRNKTECVSSSFLFPYSLQLHMCMFPIWENVFQTHWFIFSWPFRSYSERKCINPCFKSFCLSVGIHTIFKLKCKHIESFSTSKSFS